MRYEKYHVKDLAVEKQAVEDLRANYSQYESALAAVYGVDLASQIVAAMIREAEVLEAELAAAEKVEVKCVRLWRSVG